MEVIQNCKTLCRGGFSSPPKISPGPSVRMSCLNFCEEQSTEIAIMTEEGDKVMLSSRQHAEATLLTYEHLACQNAAYDRQEITLSDFTEGREVILTVEGELNEQEVADIQALLKDLGEMLQAFLTGGNKRDGSGNVGGGIDHYSTISAFEADFEYNTRATYWNLKAGKLGLQNTPEPSLTVPAALATTGGPAAQLSGPAPVPAPAAEGATAEAAPALTEYELAAGNMLRRVSESGLQPKRFLYLLEKMLRHILKEMLSKQIIQGEQAQRGEFLLKKFIGRARESAAGIEVGMKRSQITPGSFAGKYLSRAEAKLPPAVAETA